MNMIERSFDLSIKHIFGFAFDRVEDGFSRVVTGASGAIAVAVGFKACFPFGFQSPFSKGVLTPLNPRWNAQRALLSFSWLWYPNPAYREGLLLFPVLGMNLIGHDETTLRLNRFYSINPGGLL